MKKEGKPYLSFKEKVGLFRIARFWWKEKRLPIDGLNCEFWVSYMREGFFSHTIVRVIYKHNEITDELGDTRIYHLGMVKRFFLIPILFSVLNRLRVNFNTMDDIEAFARFVEEEEKARKKFIARKDKARKLLKKLAGDKEG